MLVRGYQLPENPKSIFRYELSSMEYVKAVYGMTEVEIFRDNPHVSWRPINAGYEFASGELFMQLGLWGITFVTSKLDFYGRIERINNISYYLNFISPYIRVLRLKSVRFDDGNVKIETFAGQPIYINKLK